MNVYLESEKRELIERVVKQIENRKRFWTIVVVSITFVLMALVYYVFPYENDDLSYQMIYGTNRRITTINDIVESQYAHYMRWGGRTIAHSVLQILLLIGKPFSSFINLSRNLPV